MFCQRMLQLRAFYKSYSPYHDLLHAHAHACPSIYRCSRLGSSLFLQPVAPQKDSSQPLIPLFQGQPPPASLSALPLSCHRHHHASRPSHLAAHRRPALPRLMQVRVRPPLGCGHPPLTTTPGLSTSRARSRAASLVAPDARPVNTVTTLRSSALPPKTRETLVRPQAKICKQTPSLGLPRATVLQSPRSPLR